MSAPPFDSATWRISDQHTEAVGAGFLAQVTLYAHRHRANTGGLSVGLSHLADGDMHLVGGFGYRLAHVAPALRREMYERTRDLCWGVEE